MNHFSSDARPSNVIPFRGKTISPWFYIGDSGLHEDLFTFSKGQPVRVLVSEEDLLRALAVSRPAFILIEATLSWSDPLRLISRLSQLSGAPIILLMEKKRTQEKALEIKQAYQAGIFDVAHLPLQKEDFQEMVELVLRISKTAIHR